MKNDRIGDVGPALPGILSGASRRGSSTLSTRRFVTQSHALSAPIANPRALLFAATIAIALYWIGRRLSD